MSKTLSRFRRRASQIGEAPLRTAARFRAASRFRAARLFRAAGVASEGVLDLVLPPACRLCREPIGGTDVFCRGCERELRLSEAAMRHACRQCGMPQPAATSQPAATPQPAANSSGRPEKDASNRDRDASCVHCRHQERAWDEVCAMWTYQGRVRDAIVAAKYPQQAALGHALGMRLADLVRQRLGANPPDLITFVPCHLTRRLARGGIGTAVMAAAVARTLGRPCREILKTTRPIAKQAWLDDSQRLENVRGAFVSKRSYAFPRTPGLHNRHVLVVDDVLTTGATANEVAKVLRGNGVQRVSLAVVARAVRS